MIDANLSWHDTCKISEQASVARGAAFLGMILIRFIAAAVTLKLEYWGTQFSVVRLVEILQIDRCFSNVESKLFRIVFSSDTINSLDDQRRGRPSAVTYCRNSIFSGLELVE